MRYLILPSIFLTLAAVVLVLCSFLLPLTASGSSLLLNIGTSVGSIVVSVWFIDRVVFRNLQKEKAGFRRLGLKQIRFQLQLAVELFYILYFAASPLNKAKSNSSFRNFFDDEYFSQILQIDFSTITRWLNGSGGFLNIAELCHVRLASLHATLNASIQKYGAYLGDDIAAKMETLLDSPFFKMIEGYPFAISLLKQAAGANARYNFFGGSNVLQYVKAYVASLLELCDSYDHNVNDSDIKMEKPSDIWNVEGSGINPGYARQK